MRPSPALRRFVPVIAVSALVLAACGSDDDASSDSATDSTEATTDGSAPSADTCSDTIEDGVLTIGTGSAGLPALGHRRCTRVRRGLRSSRRLRGRSRDGLRQGRRRVGAHDLRRGHPARREELRHQPAAVHHHRRAQGEHQLLPAVLHEQPGHRRPRRLGGRGRDDHRRPQGPEVRRPGRHHEPRLHQRSDPADPGRRSSTTTTSAPRLPSRRTRSTPPCSTCRPRCTCRASRSRAAASIGQFPADAGGHDAISSAAVLETDNPLTACVDQAITTLTENGRARRPSPEWLSDFTGRSPSSPPSDPATTSDVSHTTLHDRSTDPARALRAGSTPAVERHRRDQHHHRRRGADRVRPAGARMGTGPPGLLRRRRLPGELSRPGRARSGSTCRSCCGRPR